MLTPAHKQQLIDVAYLLHTEARQYYDTWKRSQDAHSGAAKVQGRNAYDKYAVLENVAGRVEQVVEEF